MVRLKSRSQATGISTKTYLSTQGTPSWRPPTKQPTTETYFQLLPLLPYWAIGIFCPNDNSTSRLSEKNRRERSLRGRGEH